MAELYFDTRNQDDPVRWVQRTNFMYCVRQVAPEIFDALEAEVFRSFKQQGVATDLWKISLYRHPMAPLRELERTVAGVIDPRLDDAYTEPVRPSLHSYAAVAYTAADHAAYWKARSRERAAAYKTFLDTLIAWLEDHNLVAHEWMAALTLDTLHVWAKDEVALKKRACANFLRNSGALGDPYVHSLYSEHMWTFLPLLPNPRTRLGNWVHRQRQRSPKTSWFLPRLPLKTPFPLPVAAYDYEHIYTRHAVDRCKDVARRWGRCFGVQTKGDARIWLRHMKKLIARRYRAHLTYIERYQWPHQYERYEVRTRTYPYHTKMQWFAYSVI